MRDHDVDRFALQLPAQRPRAERARAARRRTRRVSGGRSTSSPPSNPSRARRPVGVPERVEPARELDRDELRAPPLAARHEVEDPHAVIVACAAALGHGSATTPPAGNGPCIGAWQPDGGARSWSCRRHRRAAGPGRGLVSAAGWASGLRRLLGHVWIVTPDGVMSSDDAASARVRLEAGAAPRPRRGTTGSRRRRRPRSKDARAWRRARAGSTSTRPGRGTATTSRSSGSATSCSSWRASTSRASSACRRCCSCPRRSCGRPRSGACAGPAGAGWVERAGEQAPLRTADLVACGSETVAEQVRRLGVDDRRIVITPTGVDLDVFGATRRPGRDAARLGLEGRFVVGLGRQLPQVPRARPGGRRARRARRRHAAARRRRSRTAATWSARARARRRRPRSPAPCRARRDPRPPRRHGRRARARRARRRVPLLAAEARRVPRGGRPRRSRPAPASCRRSCTTASTRCSSPGGRSGGARGGAAPAARRARTRERLAAARGRRPATGRGTGRSRVLAAERCRWNRPAPLRGRSAEPDSSGRHCNRRSKCGRRARSRRSGRNGNGAPHGGHAVLSSTDGLRVDRVRTAAPPAVLHGAVGAAPVHVAPRAHRPQGRALRLGVGQLWIILDPLLLAAVYYLLRIVVKPVGTGANRNASSPT